MSPRQSFWRPRPHREVWADEAAARRRVDELRTGIEAVGWP